MPRLEASSSVNVPGLFGGGIQTTLGQIGHGIKSLLDRASERDGVLT